MRLIAIGSLSDRAGVVEETPLRKHGDSSGIQ